MCNNLVISACVISLLVVIALGPGHNLWYAETLYQHGYEDEGTKHDPDKINSMYCHAVQFSHGVHVVMSVCVWGEEGKMGSAPTFKEKINMVWF